MAASPSSVPVPVVVPRMKLGSQGLEVSAQGLGCMGMSASYGPPKPEPDMVKLIHHAVAAGVTFLDTSDLYGPHTNELLLGKALRGVARESVDLATKFGVSFVDGKREVRGDPAYVRAACEASLRRLGVDCIDLYYQHRVDTRVPIEVTIGELKKLVEEGKIKYIGLSEACASTIRRAHAVHPITAVQLEWSLWSRDAEEDIIPTCRELGIGIVAYCPLGSGFFSSGGKLMDSLSKQDIRRVSSRSTANRSSKRCGYPHILYLYDNNGRNCLVDSVGAADMSLVFYCKAGLKPIFLYQESELHVRGRRLGSRSFVCRFDAGCFSPAALMFLT